MEQGQIIGTKKGLYFLICITLISLFPFIILRIWQLEYVTAAMDAVIWCAVLFTGLYLYKTGDTYYPSIIIMTFFLVGSVLLINKNGKDVVNWFYPAMIAVFYLAKPKITAVLNGLAVCAMFPGLYLTAPFIEFCFIVLTLMVTNLFTYLYASHTLRQKDKMYQLAWFDSLTGVLNRRAMDKKMAKLDDVFSIIVLDIDHFKSINDAFGHRIGDGVLIHIAGIVKNRIRSSDFLYRYGGEEFVIIATGATAANAERIAEDLRQLIESEAFLEDRKITASFGIAEVQPGERPIDCFSRGDKALYQAKNSGRNQVRLAA